MKKAKNAHTANTSIGTGDYYGTAIKGPVGTIRDQAISSPVSPSKLGKPPKSLA